jgi:thiosulfate reductase cytochrome b subunit
MKRLEHKHPLVIRICHWLNALALPIMIYSGLLIYWANDVYAVRLGSLTLIRFFPNWFYDSLQLGHRLAEGMAWHFALMWVFVLNGLIYVSYTFLSGEWKYLLPKRSSVRDAWNVVLHDLGIQHEPLARDKFNGAQRIAYSGVVLMGAGSLVTGIGIYKPVQLAWLVSALGGYENARFLHFLLTLGYALFFVIHITQVVRAGWNNFRAMIVGVEVIAVEEGQP